MVSGMVVPGGRGSLEGPGNLLRLEEVETSGSSKGCGKVSKLALSFSMELQLLKFLLKASAVEAGI